VLVAVVVASLVAGLAFAASVGSEPRISPVRPRCPDQTLIGPDQSVRCGKVKALAPERRRPGMLVVHVVAGE
jgi:hypothetical protein